MRRRALTLLSALLLPGGLLAAPASLTLSEVLREARQSNPEIRAARERWSAARARIGQARTPEKPVLEFERMYAPRGENPISGATEKNIAITQELPFPTRLYLSGRKASQEAEAAEAAHRGKELDVLSRVQAAWAMLYGAHHAIHIYQDNAELMRQMARSAESRYAAGRGTQSDALKAQVELSKMLNMLVTLEQEKETAEAMLNALLDRPPQSPLALPADPDVTPIRKSLDQLQALAIERRPELAQALKEAEARRTSVALARSEYLPDLMLGYRRREMTGATDSHDAMLGLSLPLWFWKQGAMVREARAEQRMAGAEVEAMKNMTLYDVKNLLVRAQTAHRLIELYDSSVLPQSQQALKVAQAAYQSGRASFLDQLDAVRTLLGFRLEHYQHIADYVTAVANLERVVGAEVMP